MPEALFAALRARLSPLPLLLGAAGSAPGSVWDGARAWPTLAEWHAAHPRQLAALWLSSHLLHELVCDDGLPLADDAAVLAWASPLLQHYHGDAALAWPLAAWRQGRRRGVSVLHGDPTLTVPAARERLACVCPWWSAVLPRALARAPLLRGAAARLLVAEGEVLTVLTLQRGRLDGLERARLDAATPAALATWCAETAGAPPAVAVGYGIAAGAVAGIDVLDGLDAPAPARAWMGAE